MRRTSFLHWSLLAFILVFATFSAGYGQPIQLPGVTGGHVNSISVIGNELYAAAGPDIYRSTDTGKHWISLGGNLPLFSQALTVSKFGGTILAGMHAGLYVTTDDGGHWTKSEQGLTYGSIYGMTTDDSVILVNDWPYGIFRATSPMGPWTKTLDMTRQVHAMLRTDSTTYVATQGDGVYATTDDGQTWEHLDRGFSANGSYVMSMAEYQGDVVLGTIEGMYKWDTASSSWRPIQGPPTQSIMGLAVVNGDLYANDGVSHVYRLHDNSWTSISKGLPEFEQTRDLAAIGSTLFVAVSEVGLYGVEVSNPQWSSTSTGIGNLTIFQVLNFPLANGSTGLIAGGDDADFGRAWLSTDHGDSWRSADNLTNRGFHDFAWKSGTLFAGSDGEGIFASHDDGKTWNTATTETTYPGALCSTPHALLTGTTGFTQGVLRSTDNGASWYSATTNIPGANVDHVYYDSTSGKAFAGTGGIAFYASSYEGDNWEAVSPGPTAMAALTRLGDYLIAGDRTGIFLSKDNGLTWSLTTPFTNVGSVEAIGSSVLAAAKNKLWIARDVNGTGPSWALYDSLPSALDIASIAHDDRYVYLGTHDFGVWRMTLPNGSASVASTAIGDAALLRVVRSHDAVRLVSDVDEVLQIEIFDVTGRSIFEGSIGDANDQLPHLRNRVLMIRAITPERRHSQVFTLSF